MHYYMQVTLILTLTYSKYMCLINITQYLNV